MFTLSAIVRALHWPEWLGHLTSLAFLGSGFWRLGLRRTFVLSMGLDQLMAWPVFYLRVPRGVSVPYHPWLMPLIIAWAVIIWLLLELPLRDQWLPVHGVRARMLLATLSVLGLCACNPYTALFLRVPSSLKGPLANIVVMGILLGLLLHLPLWHVLVYGWREREWKWWQ